MREEEEVQTEKNSSEKEIVIDSVSFDGPITLPESIRKKVVDELKEQRFRADSDWLNDIADVPIRGAWQDDGYFKVAASARADLLRADSTTQHVALSVHVDEGPQYFLGHLAFRSADPDNPLAIAPNELRSRVLLQEGDIFAADKIRRSFDSLRQLYSSHGYIDFTAEPEFDIDEVNRRINLTLVLDQQIQYRIGRMIVLGLNPELERKLMSEIKPGDVFDLALVRQFFEENKSALPWDASLADMKRKPNFKAGTIDLTFDFFTCRTD